MDFLSAIPQPLEPIGPGPDGTPPLPFINQKENAMNENKQDDFFDADPFFNSDPLPPPEPDDRAAEAVEEFPEEPEMEPEIEPEVEPETVLEPPPQFRQLPEDSRTDTAQDTTAEEMLLNTIVGDSQSPFPQPPLPSASDVRLAALQAEHAALQADLDTALADLQETKAQRERTRQDLAILKTRFAALESDLAAARREVEKVNHLRLQAETRLTEAENQWSDKLSQFRRMLDEVEDMRNELMSKRVPKILFIGVLVAGLLAVPFAYILGKGQASHEAPPAPPAQVPAVTPPPPLPPLEPPSKPILTAEPKPVSPAPRMATAQPKPVSPDVKPAAAAWPALEGGHWKTTSTSREMKVVFDYGLFTKNTELSDGAKQDLKAVATALKGKGYKIEVEGHTDPSKATGKTAAANNKSLGLARARTASSYLTKQCGWPTGAITLSSEGDANPPHPNTTAESRKKNRTVVLKITASTAR